MDKSLVLLQGDNCVYSVAVVFRNKAQCAAKGCSLCTRCNAVAGHHSNALRVGVLTLMVCVVSLGKGVTITCEPRLAMNLDTPTECVIITLKEYWCLPTLTSHFERTFFR